MLVATIIGARPQFIKAAVVSRAIAVYSGQHPSALREVIIHTGQHFDANMSDVFFDELDIPRPDHHLGIGGGSHGQNTGRMIEALEAILIQQRPNWVLIYGDTDSTLAGALAAVKLHIPVAHVEAGLRSFNRRMPEEINRVLADHASDLLLTPTDTATRNLVGEGLSGDKVLQVGDVMYDAALYYGQRAQKTSRIIGQLELQEHRFILATIHRAENTDDRNHLGEILSGLSTSTLPVVLPIHPRTRKRLTDFGIALPENIKLIDPVGYLDMVRLECSAALIVTDSGGVQKEAFFHRVPCVTVRNETEWVETVASGWNRLTGANGQRIAKALVDFAAPTEVSHNFYGHGDAGGSIVRCLIERNRAGQSAS
ncbi:MAG: UDP-N-acetylglucosamine 2-epimerase (non-hydrolyzing) [Pirellulaceae bacterium]|nr:UDP-N-acetylglucosamine 2-epimerase (non-hydrolyzing) [Pirellulaceae bacterium]